MSSLLAQAKFEYRALVSREPVLAPLHRPIVWWTQYKQQGIIPTEECRVTSATEFVLDGFQGSGNSYATVAFKAAQVRPIRMAHHLHAPAQIIKAVDLGIPTLVTLREPAKAVVSLVSRWPEVSLHQGLRAYAAFYQKLIPYADGFVLSPFLQTIHHLDEVIETVNRRFGCDFVPFHPDGKNARSVRKATTLDADEEVRRQERKRALLETITTAPYRDALDRADDVHAEMKAIGNAR